MGSSSRSATPRGVLIRRATANDADAAAAAYTRARLDAGDALPPAVHSAAEDAVFVREVLIGTRETWLAVGEGGDILGLLTLDGDRLDQLYLVGTATGSGLGSRLVELAKRERPGGLQLWTFASNLRAQRFYERHGFEAVERTDGDGNEERAPDIRYAWVPTAGLDRTATPAR